MYRLLIFFVLITKTLSWGNERWNVCDFNTSVDITSGTHHQNHEVDFEGVRYKENEYYVDSATGAERGCICKKKMCIRKCCPLGQGYVFGTNKSCVNVSETFDPPVWEVYAYTQIGIKASQMFHYVIGKMECYNNSRRVKVGDSIFSDMLLKKDGKLYVQLQGSIPPWLTYTPDKYCIDTFVSEDPVTGVRNTFLDALICFATTPGEGHYVLSSTCMLISCVFILATVAVYAWLPELRNLHGRVLMAYLLCMFVGFAFLAAMQIMLTINDISPNTCLGFTFVIYFSLLAAFFWLNVMCFDIWWTFSGKRGQSGNITARFISYSLYAFGIPTLLTILLIGLEFSGLPPNQYLPLLRQQGCFIYGLSKLIYFYGPITVLCIANLTFFILTAVKIAQIKKQTSVLSSRDSSTHNQHRNDKQRLVLYVKLLAVMGISWILEVVSALYPDAEAFWNVTDSYNVLIGLIIFIIFVCKKKIFRLIKKRIKQKFHRRPDENNTIRDTQNAKMRRWQNNTNQRISLDTIRTSLGVESDTSVRI